MDWNRTATPKVQYQMLVRGAARMKAQEKLRRTLRAKEREGFPKKKKSETDKQGKETGFRQWRLRTRPPKAVQPTLSRRNICGTVTAGRSAVE